MIECMEMSRDLHNAAGRTSQQRRQRTRQNLPHQQHLMVCVKVVDLNEPEVCECFLELLLRHLQLEPRIESTCLSTQ